MAWWSFSAVDAGEPEERAAAEKEVEENDGERNAEKMGSEARESSADEAVAEEVGVVVVVVVGFLKVERRCIGEAAEDTGDLAAAGEAIAVSFFFFLL